MFAFATNSALTSLPEDVSTVPRDLLCIFFSDYAQLVCLFVCLFVRLFVRSFVCLFVCLLACLLACLVGCLVDWLVGTAFYRANDSNWE